MDRVPIAANLKIVLRNVARDRDRPVAAWAQGLLIAALDVTGVSMVRRQRHEWARVGAIAQARGQNSATANPFSTVLQAGILLAVLAPAHSPHNEVDAGGNFTLDPTLLWYFSTAAVPYKDRIGIQMANLFEGWSQLATARS